MKVRANNVPRDIICGYDLTQAERADFDYLSADDLDCSSFFRYRGAVYFLGDFCRWDNPASPTRGPWDGYCSDSFFSGLVVRYVDEGERIVVGTYFS
jgi:hypothetical protein